jgi:nucleotide-binding universal stress UspA family protein
VREARRAVFDSLPILAAAKDVKIAEIPEEGINHSDSLSHLEDVAAWLLSHGIVASTIVPKIKGNAAERLDEIAADIGAGLVIAGAYGHSRFREWILGGVTYHLAMQPRRCSFLSRSRPADETNNSCIDFWRQ